MTRWRPVGARPPTLGDLLVRPLRDGEEVPVGWTLAWQGSERCCYRTVTGGETVDSSRDVYATPPPVGAGPSPPSC